MKSYILSLGMPVNKTAPCIHGDDLYPSQRQSLAEGMQLAAVELGGQVCSSGEGGTDGKGLPVHGNTCVYYTSKEKMQKEEKGSFRYPTPNQHPNAHIKITNTTHTKEQDTGCPALRNWGGRLKIFHRTNSPHIYTQCPNSHNAH